MTDTEQRLFAQVATKDCGCVVAASCEYNAARYPQFSEKEWNRDLAKHVAGWIRDGLHVSRMDITEVRISLTVCKCGKKQEAEQSNLFQP